MTSWRPVPTAEEVWRAYDATEARLTAPLSARMLDLARVGPGMRVLDLATGRGELRRRGRSATPTPRRCAATSSGRGFASSTPRTSASA